MKIGLINIALSLFAQGKFKSLKNIIDLGSKELRVDFNQLKYSFDQVGIKFNKKNFNILKKFPKGKRISTEYFWKELGVKKYNSSDINKKSKFFIDLNYPLKNKKLKGNFDLVNDFGNNEHVFNVGESYKTMYELCKKNGFIWIFQSVYGGNGFFNFDKSFFEGYAAANNLSVIFSSYLVHVNEYDQFAIPCNKDLFSVLDLTKIKDVSITYIFRKNTNDQFKYYYQYNVNNNQRPFDILFQENYYPSEKIYIPSKNLSKIKKDAQKGDQTSIDWLRALGKKI